MNLEIVRQTIIDRMRRHSETVDVAAREVIRGFGIADRTIVDQVVTGIREEGRRNQMLKIPPTMHSREYLEDLKGEARIHSWYTGPEKGDAYWPLVRARLEESGAEFVESVDLASTAVVAHLADPNYRNLKKKGLVVGYVQSGKTANYTGVIAKAADAGYRLFIVMSGLHNNLRKQTQTRLEADLLSADWAKLTTSDEDFGRVLGGHALVNAHVPMIAVVKKNPTRLKRLRDWLRDVDKSVRERCPILILDDEADQATPNSARLLQERNAINRLVGEIWAETITGSYVGYTATPFANVFIDPDDVADVYPSNFIIDLPRSDSYFGAERIFGRQALDDADNPDDGLDMVREVADWEAEALVPRGTKEDRDVFDPELAPSLRDAIQWFLLASAVRRARGQVKHSSMLIHTTHYVSPHFAMRDRVRQYLDGLDCQDPALRQLFDREIGRAQDVATQRIPSWNEVLACLPEVLSETRVVVDNGRSDDRLDYEKKNEAGHQIPVTVIAIGGATLSRGLTLEGLVVSYFIRSANTYDTLLQMGRWFGYRPGYEDLPRIWMPTDLADDFRFLALVEEEIRRDMRSMQRLGLTPEEYGVRVRTHPGRLEITAKMGAAEPVRVSFSGQRRQTFILHESDETALKKNLAGTRGLIKRIGANTFQTGDGKGARWIARGVSAATIARFVQEYEFHKGQPSLSSDLVSGWITRVASDIPWNVVVMGSSASPSGASTGTCDLGFASPVPRVNRAPLKNPPSDTANIKALLSAPDWTADLNRVEVQSRLSGGMSHEEARRAITDHGLLLVFPIDPNSRPMGAAEKFDTRRTMKAACDVIGLGFVFPTVKSDRDKFDAAYYSAHPDWSVATDDLELPVDTEDSTEIRATDLLGGTR